MTLAIDMSDRPFGVPPDMVLDLPAPPSVNKVRKIDWSNHAKVRKWKSRADDHVLYAKCRKVNPLKLRRIARFELRVLLSEHHTRIDLDNCLKVLIDYLCLIELIEDDAPDHMRKLVVEWGIAPEGCRVTVVPLA